MRYGYIREGKPWSITTQVRMLLDYECDRYLVESPSYSDQTEWQTLMSQLQPGDEVIVPSLLAVGDTSQRVRASLDELEASGASWQCWSDVFHETYLKRSNTMCR